METKKAVVVTLVVNVIEPPVQKENEDIEEYWERIEDWTSFLDEQIREKTYKLLEVKVPDEEPNSFLEMSEVYRFINKPDALKLYEEYKADQRDGFVSNVDQWIETKMAEKNPKSLVPSDVRIMKEDIRELIKKDSEVPATV
jgi:hypothetical protein